MENRLTQKSDRWNISNLLDVPGNCKLRLGMYVALSLFVSLWSRADRAVSSSWCYFWLCDWKLVSSSNRPLKSNQPNFSILNIFLRSFDLPTTGKVSVEGRVKTSSFSWPTLMKDTDLFRLNVVSNVLSLPPSCMHQKILFTKTICSSVIFAL